MLVTHPKKDLEFPENESGVELIVSMQQVNSGTIQAIVNMSDEEMLQAVEEHILITDQLLELFKLSPRNCRMELQAIIEKAATDGSGVFRRDKDRIHSSEGLNDFFKCVGKGDDLTRL